MSRTKQRFQRTASPLDAVILGVDPGQKAGWSIFTPEPHLTDGLREWGKATTWRTRRAAILRAQAIAGELGLPLIIVIETFMESGTGVGRGTFSKNMRTVTGMGGSRDRWEESALIAGQPQTRILKLDTGTWRTQLWGKSKIKTEVAERMACNWVESRWDIDLSETVDTAMAICIGAVARFWGKAFDRLPKKRKGAGAR